LAAIAQIVAKILWPHVPQGVPTIIVVCLFLGSIQLLSIAFVAEYVGKIFEEVKQRPQFVVTKRLNFDTAQVRTEPMTPAQSKPTDSNPTS
jgi:polyisoprenyl-phosphate glycosyltransferase